ncbi:hypothetical protein BDW74DRAFT_94777 [Aspergillus multicolor]|uniref:uncharacterized protein n=1 Tax=Aspergillus multicolor TaxID=41759 RepID=UPI003CCD77A6
MISGGLQHALGWALTGLHKIVVLPFTHLTSALSTVPRPLALPVSSSSGADFVSLSPLTNAFVIVVCYLHPQSWHGVQSSCSFMSLESLMPSRWPVLRTQGVPPLIYISSFLPFLIRPFLVYSSRPWGSVYVYTARFSGLAHIHICLSFARSLGLVVRRVCFCNALIR